MIKSKLELDHTTQLFRSSYDIWIDTTSRHPIHIWTNGDGFSITSAKQLYKDLKKILQDE